MNMRVRVRVTKLGGVLLKALLGALSLRLKRLQMQRFCYLDKQMSR